MSVSTIIPTYNRKTDVVRAIDSVMAQTVPVDEIIVVDDGSTDGTAEAIRSRYGQSVRLFVQQNAGAAAARNRGIREATGEWIAFLDSDDLWLPAKIERQLAAIAAFGPEFGLCFTDCYFDGDPEMHRSAFQNVGLCEQREFGVFAAAANSILTGQEPFYTPTILANRLLLKQTGEFDEALSVREDTDVFFRLSLRTKFCFVSTPLVRVDRTPSRSVGLCKLYATRDDRKYASLERLYTRWLLMPEVVGTEYESQIREELRLLYYSSAAAKIHDLRFGPAFGKVRSLKQMGESYPSVIFNLLARKVRKLFSPINSAETEVN